MYLYLTRHRPIRRECALYGVDGPHVYRRLDDHDLHDLRVCTDTPPTTAIVRLRIHSMTATGQTHKIRESIRLGPRLYTTHRVSDPPGKVKQLELHEISEIFVHISLGAWRRPEIYITRRHRCVHSGMWESIRIGASARVP
jgi:hypothetical protein